MVAGRGHQNYRLIKWLLTVCLVAIVLILTACGSKTTTTPPVTTRQVTTTPATTTPPVTTAPLVTTTPTAEALVIIDIGDPGFYPQTITVAVGTIVTWTNLSYDVHNVTSDTGLFDSPLRDNSSEPINSFFSYAFTERGTYSYHCSIYPSMIGMVIIE